MSDMSDMSDIWSCLSYDDI